VCDGSASDGYLAVAPALYDRVGRNLVFGYASEDLPKRRAARDQVQTEQAMLDVAAAIAEASKAGKVGIVGYCWGGSIAWLAAARLDGLSCAVSYYGTGIVAAIDAQPRCPVLLHWGASDPGAPPEAVEKIEAAHPMATSHVYDAGHAFNNPETRAYNAQCASAARKRTIDFLRRHLG
jgi:carboxymethylenebutenolidase